MLRRTGKWVQLASRPIFRHAPLQLSPSYGAQLSELSMAGDGFGDGPALVLSQPFRRIPDISIG
jgi:hypothetical protein